MSLLHLGPVHPVEQALVIGLAFGPFLLLALTIWISRRRHSAAEASADPVEEPADEPVVGAAGNAPVSSGDNSADRERPAS